MARTRKNIIFVNQKQDILEKIINKYIQYENGRKYFYLDFNDGDNFIGNLEDDIKKCFCVSKWAVYNRNISKNRDLLVVKSIFRDMGKELTKGWKIKDSNKMVDIYWIDD